MKYAKPVISSINEAMVAIQNQLPKTSQTTDGTQNGFVTIPAYEADE
jgi:hypothetical protein